MKKDRIEILDGLRSVAILMVMIYHFYTCFANVYYSYSVKCPVMFEYGSLGVQLFFIISGFVITLTLSKSKGLFDFIKKRFVRLIPGMAICSSFTFLFAYFLDTGNVFPFAKSLSNLIVSNTFIQPSKINILFGTHFDYIDGAYWSLWIEFQFYIIAGFLYFLSPKYFLRNYLILTAISSTFYFIFSFHDGSNIAASLASHKVLVVCDGICKTFTLFKHNLWFLAGIIIHHLYYVNKNRNLVFLLSGVFLVQILIDPNLYKICFIIIVVAIFLLFLYRPKHLTFFENRILRKIGMASYSIYLVHENVGLLILNRFSVYFGTINWIIPIFLIFIFTVFGLISYKYLEVPFSKKLRSLFFKKSQPFESLHYNLTRL